MKEREEDEEERKEDDVVERLHKYSALLIDCWCWILESGQPSLPRYSLFTS